MKETKVYVDELPKSCRECKFHSSFSCVLYDHPRVCKDIIEKTKNPYCSLQLLKTHDRELVKEVCEKIKEQLGFIVDGQERISCDGSATGDKTILAVLNQIQKEYEK